MKRFSALLVASFLCLTLHGQVYTDASAFPLNGKAFCDSRYERLPESYELICRSELWGLGRNSAGLYIRFCSDSPDIWCRWTALFGNSMNHQALSGTRGVDLYLLTPEGQWRFAACGRPGASSRTTEALLISNMSREMREYMLYLPLYDGIESLEIGVDSLSVLEAPRVNSPVSEGPIVMYGTSILQGGCASRPGMAFTSIISRALNREVINLGFSGNALLDLPIASLMAQVSAPSIYVLDYVPNASAQQIRERGEEFFSTLRSAHPDVPVLFLEDPQFGEYGLDSVVTRTVDEKNAAQRELFEKLRSQGEKNIWYLRSEGLLGSDNEAFVDGTHFTDLGMMRYAERLIPVIRKRMKK